jgi:phosphotransferase system  glucose/maltose/N-acetylglucosamine-specific IIC component
MANNSAKKNEQNIRTTAVVLTWVTYALIAWFVIANSMFLTSETVSIWHWLLCVAVAASSYFCFKQIIKCWELQLPSEAAEYYYDLLALNSIVELVDPFTHSVW